MNWNILKSNITCMEAEEIFLNDHIVFLAPHNDDHYRIGDVIYAGNFEGAWELTEKVKPPEGYAYFMTKGNNLIEMHPIEVRYDEF